MTIIEFERLRLMRRAARVIRCHTMPMRHYQTVGEHTFGVLAILHLVYPEARPELWLATLRHDVVEAVTGDVPANAKWEFPMLEEGLKDAELHTELLYELNTDLKDDEKKILKYCDIMELAIYSIEEADGGDKRAVQIADKCLQAIRHRGLIDITPNALHLYDAVKADFEQEYPEHLRYKRALYHG